MRRLVGLLVLVVGLAIPVVAFGEGSPPPAAAVAACQTEAKAIGNDAFVAKYGPSEPWGHCYAAHATATQTTTTETTTTTTVDHRSPTAVAVAACQSLARSLGKEKFAARFGGKEGMGACVKAALGKRK